MASSASANLPLKIGLLFIAVLVSCGFGEIALRLLDRQSLAPDADEKSLTYRYDAELGWFPRPNSRKQITGSRTITAIHNSRGFRDAEPARPIQPGIVFLGDSLVWGYDVEADERFTEDLQAKHPDWPIYNFGVSGFGTDQEFLLLQRYFEEYRPQAVFLVICGDNDNEDNAWNCRGGYYKPWYTFEGGKLRLNGVPVPKSEKTFIAEHPFVARSYVAKLLIRTCYKLISPFPAKNPDPPTGVILLEMRKYVAERGAFFGVGLQHSSAELEKFLHDFNIPYVDLSTTNPAQIYPAFGNHWTPEGHKFVAERIDQFFLAQNYKLHPAR